MTTVVLVDDQELVRDGFRVILDHEPDIEVVGEAADGVEALAVVASADPDVVLLDIRMPRMDGLEALQLLVARGCRARIVVLTTFGLDDYVSKAFGLGASGFLLKNCGRAALVDGVRTVASGDALLAPQLTRRLIEHFVASAPAMPVTDPRTDALSRRELEVLRLIAR
ncbi:MAG: response regulator transcription factor [Chloroflexota bacterium]|nr:response regulator transcription factor [Chloroflexota bacterium]